MEHQPVQENDVTSKSKSSEHYYRELGLCRFCPLSDLSAETFLRNFIQHRGYTFEKKPANVSCYKRPILPLELQRYTKNLIADIGDKNFTKLVEEGKIDHHILACNQFGESTLHLAARKSYDGVVRYILQSEESPILIDDYGRSALSDAMWAVHPSFSIIAQLLDKYTDLLFLTDVRGCTPLSYVRKEHVLRVCLFLFSKRDQYWPVFTSVAPQEIHADEASFPKECELPQERCKRKFRSGVEDCPAPDTHNKKSHNFTADYLAVK